jgi:hypothetical protein
LAENLNLASQFYQTELRQEAVKMWSVCFRKEKPEAIAWAFREHFRSNQYPPRPADIGILIRQKREAVPFEGWNSDL